MTNTIPSPYLSIVATSRNDDHGGNLVGRMQAFADNIGEFAVRHNVSIELIVVEWNPPADKPKLKDVVKWPSNTCVTTRIIEVPNEIHKRFDNSDRLPLFQMIAKNVGIRRAKADFILATNVDVLFPDRFYRWLSERTLAKHVIYRTDRFDVDRSVTQITGADSQLEFCPKHVVALQLGSTTTVVEGDKLRTSLAIKAAGAKTYASMVAKRASTVLRLAVKPRKNRSHLHYHVPRLMRDLLLPSDLPRLHLNACGDFQLMHKDDWDAIQGYYEYEGFSMHLDVCAGYAAYKNGIKLNVLPFPVYHIDHTGGWSIQTEKDGSFQSMVKNRGMNMIDLAEFEEKLFSKSGDSLYTNPDAWGLQAEDLYEH